MAGEVTGPTKIWKWTRTNNSAAILSRSEALEKFREMKTSGGNPLIKSVSLPDESCPINCLFITYSDRKRQPLWPVYGLWEPSSGVDRARAEEDKIVGQPEPLHQVQRSRDLTVGALAPCTPSKRARADPYRVMPYRSRLRTFPISRYQSCWTFSSRLCRLKPIHTSTPHSRRRYMARRSQPPLSPP